MKKYISNILLVLVFLVGLSLLLYPSFSNWWNEQHTSRAIASYSEEVANLDEEQYKEIWESALAYNQNLAGTISGFNLDDDQKLNYNQLLNVGDNGIMGYIEIPMINVKLPIYHGTDEAVLQIAAGHLEWSSLPVGGAGSHCVLSGHRGLPSAKLFTDLDRLVEGDTFILRVLNEVLTYQVDQILIVEPQDTEALQIVPGKDYCTLVTCTPYGINSHRLLVRGHRVDNAKEALNVHVTSDAVQIEPIIIAPIIATPLLIMLVLYVVFKPKKDPKRKKSRKSEGGGV